MKMKVILCDMDGSLMPPSSGLYVSQAVCDRLVQLQQKGVRVVLNSARVLQGVVPCAKQIRSEQFGGIAISCNGCHCMDVKTKETLFEYTIDKKTALWIWDLCLKYGLTPGISQPDRMLAEDLSIGYSLDRNNCEVDYLLTRDPEQYIQGSIWKCCISAEEKLLKEQIDLVKNEIESHCDVKVIQSTPTMVDIVSRKADKTIASDRLLKMLGVEWKDVSVIGDGNSDAGCIAKAGLGVTLENGTESCKAVCDQILPSVYDEGCLVWLDKLLEG